MNSSSLNKAIELRKQGKLEESREIILSLSDENPDDPELLYQCAWSCDLLGKEKEACEYYESAIEKGLSGESLRGAFLGLGSTYRCLGKYENSWAVLEKGISHFPDARELQVFLSLTLYNLGIHDRAMEIMIRNLIETTDSKDISSYRKALMYYKDRMDETWE